MEGSNSTPPPQVLLEAPKAVAAYYVDKVTKRKFKPKCYFRRIKMTYLYS